VRRRAVLDVLAYPGAGFWIGISPDEGTGIERRHAQPGRRRDVLFLLVMLAYSPILQFVVGSGHSA
jgi:hypothetical protein